MEDLKIWVTYHKDSLIDEYNLDKLDKNIWRLFNVNSQTDEDNINHLNNFYCEICTIYYVWKNQIKSNFVGFCHYRRLFDNLIHIEDDECLYISDGTLMDNIYNSYVIEHSKLDICNASEYLRANGYHKEDDLLSQSNYLIMGNCFIISWDNFNKLCDYLFGVLFNLDKLYGLNMNPDNYKQKYYNDFISYNLKYTPEYQQRGFAFLSERLISVWLRCHTKSTSVQINKPIFDGRPQIYFNNNSHIIDIERNKYMIDYTMRDILVNGKKYIFFICCDKNESDIKNLCIKRQQSLIELLQKYNIQPNKYVIYIKGITNYYNNNRCISLY